MPENVWKTAVNQLLFITLSHVRAVRWWTWPCAVPSPHLGRLSLQLPQMPSLALSISHDHLVQVQWKQITTSRAELCLGLPEIESIIPISTWLQRIYFSYPLLFLHFFVTYFTVTTSVPDVSKWKRSTSFFFFPQRASVHLVNLWFQLNHQLKELWFGRFSSFFSSSG